MTHVRRLGAVGAVLALAALYTTAVRGGPDKDDRKDEIDRRVQPADPVEDLTKSKFADRNLIVYETREGAKVFGWQVKAALEAAANRPRDLLLMVDTSASQNRGPLHTARTITEEILKNLGDNDAASVWTANVEPKKLTKTFLSKGKHDDAIKELKKEYPSGASNLKKALTEAVNAFDNEIGRQRVVVLMGDGMSVAGPLSPDDLAHIAGELVKKQISVFSVPLGAQLDPLVLHGFATATGGSVVRTTRDRKPEEFVKDLDLAIRVPVLYPETVKYSDSIAEAFPARMPPLRGDAPTLVVGKLNKNAERLGCTIVGVVAGKETRIDVAEALPGDEPDNFFLAGMFEQWREAKDLPALLKADRALTYTWEQMQIAKAELMAQADWALEKNELQAAAQLYEQALKMDHNDLEAKAGLRLVQQLKDGKITRAEFRKLIAPKGDDAVVRIQGKMILKGKVNREKLLAMAQEREKEKAEEIKEERKADDLLNQVKQRQAVEDQRNTELVKDAIAEAGRMLRTNPDAAIEMLKRTRAGVEDNPDISDRARRALTDRLQDEIRNLSVAGEGIRRTLAERAQALAIARERLGQQAEQQASEERIKERMRTINQLMNTARLEIIRQGDFQNRLVAIRAAEKLKLDLMEEGKPVPPALNAIYGIAQADFHLQELRELRRQREQRFLLSMLQIERRHMPFPDEPPIEFPPAAKWKALTISRKSKYESFRFMGSSSNKGLKRTLDVLNSVPNPPEFPELPADPQTKLGNVLNALANKFSKPGETPPFFLTFEINVPAFQAEGIQEPTETPIVQEKALKKEVNITLATYIRRILERVPVPSGATFVIRKEQDLPIIIPQYDERDLPPAPNYVVEITTGSFAARHKETIAYSVSDLVVPIPNSINQQALQQSSTLFGQFGMSGGVVGQFGQNQQGQLGALGALGQFGQGLGALGALGGGALGALGALGGGALGALGALGGGALGGGALGALGGGALGAGGALGGGVLGAGQVGVQGQANFGVGGGQAGFGGGQLGQFGNLGGQFGLQGGTQEGILMNLIVQLVGTPRDWAGLNPALAGPGQIPGGNPGDPGGPPMDDPLRDPLGNQLGYFPSALALVVKGTSVIHSRSTRVAVGGLAPPPPPGGGAAGAAGARLPGDNGERVVIGGDPKKNPKRNVIGAGNGNDAKVAKRPPFKSDADPRVAWQEGLEKGIDDPGMVVATVDFLMLIGKFDHAAELLKANLRQGVVVRPWVYETLSICLRETNAAQDEIERAEVAMADLEPQDASGFLKASQAMAGLKSWDRAIAFCRQAALLEPNAPQSYSEALNYAEMAKDAGAMEWAAGNLLKQDWPRKNGDLHNRAMLKLNALSKELTGDRAKDAERLQTVAKQNQQRDLIIRLSWVGQADLDLKVQEPSGNVCSALSRQTPGGGSFMGDTLAEKNQEMYVAAQAFPGKYTITVDRVWGNTGTGKAQVQVLRGKGTDKESSQFFTVDLKEDRTLVLDLENGRRSQFASVPPPSLQQQSEELDPGASTDELLARLRDAADPELTGVTRGFRGRAGSPGVLPTEDNVIEVKGKLDAEAKKSRRDILNNQFIPVESNVRSNVGFTTQATVTGDRRHVRLSLNPVFNKGVGGSTKAVTIPVIPGLGK